MATRRIRPEPGTGTEEKAAKATGPAPRKKKASAPAAAARKPTRKRAAPRVDAAAPDDKNAPAPTGLWRAGLKALDTVRQDVTRRHTNVIETLLGIAPPRPDAEGKPTSRSFPGLETLGLRKFEDVFDQRVAAALERLGVPTRDEVAALRAQLDEALAQIERLRGGSPAPRKRGGGSRSR
ncbi:MAG: phasin family protein [Proteobacteria bacterium]|nr:phasin family protein [Pseudomonadota bacterium]